MPDGAELIRPTNLTRSARSVSPSKAPIVKRRGRKHGLRCLSPQGELAKHAAHGIWRLGIAAGDATVGCASLLTFLHKQESEAPAGAKPGRWLSTPLHPHASVLVRNTIPYVCRCWFRPQGRPTFLARKKVGKETHPAFRGPAGSPRCPNAQQVTSPTLPLGSDSEVTSSADHSGDSARQRDWGRAGLKLLSDLDG